MLRNRWFKISAIACVVMVGLVMALAHFLPVYVEKRLIPHWTAQMGFDPAAISIRRVDLDGADVGPFRMRLDNSPFLDVGAVQIDYSVVSIARKSIKALTINGVYLTLTLNEQGKSILELDRLNTTSGKAPKGAPLSLERLLPVAVGRIVLRNAVLDLHWRGRTYFISIQIELDTSQLGKGRLQGAGKLQLRGNTLSFTVTADQARNVVDLEFQAKQAAIENVSDVIHLFTPSFVSGQLDLNGDVRCSLQPLILTAGDVTAQWTQASLRTGALTIQNALSGDGAPTALVFKAASVNGFDWQWSAAPFQINGPLTVNVARLTGHYVKDGQSWEAAATAATVIPAQPLVANDNPPVRFDKNFMMQWTVNAVPDEDNTIQVQVHAGGEQHSETNSVIVRHGDTVATGQAPYLSVEGHIKDGDITAHLHSGIEKLTVQSGQVTATCAKPAITADVSGNQEHPLNIAVNLPAVQVNAGSAEATVTAVRVEGTLSRPPSGQWQLAGKAAISGGRLQDRAHDIEVKSFQIEQPLHWPLTEHPPAGRLTAGPILWKNRDVGKLKGQLQIVQKGLKTSITYKSKLFQGLNVNIQSKADASGVTATVEVPTFSPASEIDLGRLFPEWDWAKGMAVNGRLAARALFDLHGETPAATADIRIEQGTVRQLRQQLAIEGINCDLHMADVITMRSGSGQRLKVDHLTMGKIAAGNLKMDFQLEPDSTLFIEKVQLSWCKGKVQAAAMRLKPELDDLSATLYCDRLNLAMVLDQLGAASGSGEGNVNGRVPIRWQKGQLSFDDGFLYSTPGQTGTIQLEDTQFLLEGLPPGSPQMVQLKIANEALKDYSYNWAKLKLQSQGERLLVTLELDGKPNRLLPFAFNQQTGTLQAVTGQGQAEFKGIGLTLNFNTPLNDILQYKGLIRP